MFHSNFWLYPIHVIVACNHLSVGSPRITQARYRRTVVGFFTLVRVYELRRDGKLHEFAAQGQPVFFEITGPTRELKRAKGWLSAHFVSCLAMLAAGLGGRVNQFSLDRASRVAVLQKSGLEGRAVPSLATFSKTCRVRTSMSLAGRPRCLFVQKIRQIGRSIFLFYRWLGGLGAGTRTTGRGRSRQTDEWSN